MILPGTNEAGAALLAERLLGQGSRTSPASRRTGDCSHIPVCVGITTWISDGALTPEDLTLRAGPGVFGRYPFSSRTHFLICA